MPGSFEEFATALGEVLGRLYDPTHQPAEVIWTVAGCDPQRGVAAVQEVIIEGIESLKPASFVPPTARGRRLYGLLHCRYVQGLTQEESAEYLGISPRHLRREQLPAVRLLAARLWERHQEETLSAEDAAQNGQEQPDGDLQSPPADGEAPSRSSQLAQELASLRASAPGAVANVGEAIASVLRLGHVLTSPRGIELVEGAMPSDMVAAIHPTALRHVLLASIRQLVRLMQAGRIVCGAQWDEGRIVITVTGDPIVVARLPTADYVREILSAHGGSVEIACDRERASYAIRLSPSRVTVLVVDDNAQLVHVYRRYVVGTRYHIVHVAQGNDAFEAVSAYSPDIIVLDVMLPDVDGWELLVDLHEHASARSIPVIVCSVMRGEDLALALGAVSYLPKPVARQQFVGALDQALNGVAAGSTAYPASSEATD